VIEKINLKKQVTRWLVKNGTIAENINRNFFFVVFLRRMTKNGTDNVFKITWCNLTGFSLKARMFYTEIFFWTNMLPGGLQKNRTNVKKL
jgi:hypothetical protein